MLNNLTTSRCRIFQWTKLEAWMLPVRNAVRFIPIRVPVPEISPFEPNHNFFPFLARTSRASTVAATQRYPAESTTSISEYSLPRLGQVVTDHYHFMPVLLKASRTHRDIDLKRNEFLRASLRFKNF